jgi:hypothetical protein
LSVNVSGCGADQRRLKKPDFSQAAQNGRLYLPGS